MPDAVIIFARLPKAGKVKKRLAAKLGEDFAARFYKICAEHTFNECRKPLLKETVVYIFIADENDLEPAKNWAGNDFRYVPQTGTDIGERMYNAFKFVFSEGIEKAVLIGTDIPDISEKIIANALDLLEQNEVVIGPAEDGGYYLIGMKELNGFIFEKQEWGTGSVYAETINRLTKNNTGIETIAELYDIDTEENLKKWISFNRDIEIYPVKEFVKEYFAVL
jgi:rSAM/selenodomain-associated transferase 1